MSNRTMTKNELLNEAWKEYIDIVFPFPVNKKEINHILFNSTLTPKQKSFIKTQLGAKEFIPVSKRWIKITNGYPQGGHDWHKYNPTSVKKPNEKIASQLFNYAMENLQRSNEFKLAAMHAIKDGLKMTSRGNTTRYPNIEDRIFKNVLKEYGKTKKGKVNPVSKV